MTVMLVLTPMAGPLVGMVGLVSADESETEKCQQKHTPDDPNALLVPYDVIVGAANTALCTITDGVDTESDITVSDIENKSTNETYNTALNVINVRDNEERLIDSLLNTPAYSKSPVRQESELKSAQYYVNTDPANRTETEFIQVAKDVVLQEYNDVRLPSLDQKYNRDMGNSERVYSRLTEANSTSLMSVYVNGSEVDTSGGINFSVPDSLNDTANGTSVTFGGDSFQVATVTVNGMTYDYRDDLAITIEDPAGESPEVPTTGQDNSIDRGAENYEPEISPSEADVVVAADGSGDYTTIMDGMDAAPDGGVVYVQKDTYTGPINAQPSLSNFDIASNLTVVSNGATVEGHGVIVDGGHSLTIRGFVILDDIEAGGSGGNTLTAENMTVLANGTYAEQTVNVQDASTVRISGSVMKTGPSGAYSVSTTNSDPLTISDSVAPDSSASEISFDNVDQYVFSSFTQDMVDTQQSDRDEILTAYGDSSDGYYSDVWSDLQTGEIGITDIVTYEQMFSESFSENDIGSRAWLDAQYMQAGMTGSVSSTAEVTVDANSTVYADARQSQANNLDSAKTYEGHIWTSNAPANGTWEANTTYNTQDLGGKVFMTYYTDTQYTENGSLVVETVSKTVAIEGTFTLDSITGENGTSLSSVDVADAPSADPYNASTYTEDVQNVNERINQNSEELKANDGGSTSNTGDCGIEIFGVCSGISYFQVSLAGLVLIGIPILYLIRPLFGVLDNLSK
jgi:hypothetical protein